MGSAKAQGVLWGAGAREWSQLIEPCQVPFYEAAFDAMGLRAGMTYLDAGCGSGLALELARGRGVTPTGLDASEGLLEVARERVGDAGLHQGDLEEMPFGDGTFDAVSAFNSVQFAADPVRAVSEMVRVAKSAAPVAVTTWASPDRCEMGAVLGALAALLPPPPPGTGGPFALSAPGAVESVAESAGLTSFDLIEVATPFTFSGVDTGVRALMATGPGRRAAEHAGESAARSAVESAFARFAQSDGSVVTNNVFRVLVARA
ncbi:MAG TPA: class I SAM-dependent methyltransferase [Acidimicrobiales bacterium]|nr:class I SAM-dependent methyltransferase [Acidimicrobiales bacterium]